MVKFSRVLQAVFVLQPLSATIPFNLGAANDSLTSEFKYLSVLDATSPVNHSSEESRTKIK